MGEAALVADITPGPGGSNPSGLRPLGHMVLFDALQQEPWRTDGTRAGTLRLAQAGLRVGAAGATRFFAGEDLGHGTELWKTDGTAAGTVLVKD
ncbi:MAG TPA: hyalin, partial [Vicinamibacteria bacterium]|nr:hyalin [Vicinamibacteria bacterium]